MENAIKSNNLVSVKKLIKNGTKVNGVTKDGVSFIEYALAFEKSKIAEYLRECGAKINQSNLDELLSQHISRMERSNYMMDNTSKPAHVIQKFKTDLKFLKFMIKFGASTNHLMNYHKYAAMFPESSKGIKKIHKTILTAASQQKAKKAVLNKMKQQAKKKKIQVLLLNKSSVKGVKNLPHELQKKITALL